MWQSHEHTHLLMETFGVKTLWDDHGVVADILVNIFNIYFFLVVINCVHSHLQHHFLELTFMNSWHQIYFIISLRAHLKTTSLSGLVSILYYEYGKTWVATIMADIDHH